MQGQKISDSTDTNGHATTILKGIPEWGNQQSSREWRHLLTKCTAVFADCSQVTGTVSTSVIKYSLTGAFCQRNCQIMYVPPPLPLHNSAFRPNSALLCFIWFSEQAVTTSLFRICQLVFEIKVMTIYLKAGIQFVNICYTECIFQTITSKVLEKWLNRTSVAAEEIMFISNFQGCSVNQNI